MENQSHQHIHDGKAAFGVFLTKSEANAAKDELKKNGFSKDDIAVMYPPHRGPRDFLQLQKNLIGTGALVGAIIGGALFLLLWSMPTFQTSPFFADRIFVAVLGFIFCVAFGAASGTLVGIGTPKTAGHRYGDYVDAGGILMSVHINEAEEASKAQKVLERSGAQDISLLDESKGWESVYAKFAPSH